MLGIPVLMCSRSEADTALTLQINKSYSIPGGLSEEDMKISEEKFAEWDSKNKELLAEMFDSKEKVEEYSALRSAFLIPKDDLWSRLSNFDNTLTHKRQWLERLKSEIPRFKESISQEPAASSESLVVKRLRVLKAIYELAAGSMSELVMYHDIESETKIDSKIMTGILQYLERKELIFMGGEWAQLTFGGIDQIEAMQKNPEKPTSVFPANIYLTTYHVHDGGVQQVGDHNTQHNLISPNRDFDVAIEELISAAENSSLQPIQKITLKADAVALKELATLEKTPEVLQMATSRIDGIKEIISMTADMTSLGTTVLPIIWAMFGR